MVSYLMILFCTVLLWLGFVGEILHWRYRFSWYPAIIAIFIQTMVMIYDTGYLIEKGW